MPAGPATPPEPSHPHMTQHAPSIRHSHVPRIGCARGPGGHRERGALAAGAGGGPAGGGGARGGCGLAAGASVGGAGGASRRCAGGVEGVCAGGGEGGGLNAALEAARRGRGSARWTSSRWCLRPSLPGRPLAGSPSTHPPVVPHPTPPHPTTHQDKLAYVEETRTQQQGAFLQVLRRFVEVLSAGHGSMEGDAMHTGARRGGRCGGPGAALVLLHSRAFRACPLLCSCLPS